MEVSSQEITSACAALTLGSRSQLAERAARRAWESCSLFRTICTRAKESRAKVRMLGDDVGKFFNVITETWRFIPIISIVLWESR